MRLMKVLLGAAAAGAIVLAFRDLERRRWLAPALPGVALGDDDRYDEEDEDEEYDEEPVLGYDGMDRDTLVGWLDDANLDEETLLRILRYEESHDARDPVLDKLSDLLASFG